jgi:hypothetical protein
MDMDNQKLLVRVIRRADFMLSVSEAFSAKKIVSEVFIVPTNEEREAVYGILDWLVEIGDLHLAHNIYDVPPAERIYVR